MTLHPKAYTTDSFIEKVKKAHGDRFDYSLVDYKNIDTKVDILCPEHGIFQTTPYRHMKGVICQQCAGPNYRGLLEHGKKTRLGKEEFIKRAKAKHGEKYDYSKVVYVNNREKVEIICPIHGSFFQPPDNHMKGVGCPGCKFDKTTPLLALSAKKRQREKKFAIVGELKKIHNNKYDYSRVKYKSWDGSIEIVCPVHGVFNQTVNNHRQGRGCPKCAPSGFDEKIPAILYYIKITLDDRQLYKIGITNRTVEKRYPLVRDREKIEIIKTWEYPLGSEARKMERKIIRAHKEKLYFGELPLDRVGIAEIFTEDVLMLCQESVEGGVN